MLMMDKVGVSIQTVPFTKFAEIVSGDLLCEISIEEPFPVREWVVLFAGFLEVAGMQNLGPLHGFVMTASCTGFSG